MPSRLRPRRHLRRLLRHLRGGPPRHQRLRRVSRGGVRLKRVILCVSHAAAAIARNLDAFAGSPHFPPLLHQAENEIWLLYVEGEPVDQPDAWIGEQMADLFATPYARQPRRCRTAETPYLVRLEQDLAFLHAAGLLGRAAHDDLRQAAHRLSPAELWVGYDYTDPLPKNFVRRRDSGRLCAVDVEALEAEALIGLGLAKALHRWLTPHRAAVLARLEAEGAPAIAPYLPFLELSYHAGRAKRKVLELKTGEVDRSAFERFRRP
jgi:hypothetical protein